MAPIVRTRGRAAMRVGGWVRAVIAMGGMLGGMLGGMQEKVEMGLVAQAAVAVGGLRERVGVGVGLGVWGVVEGVVLKVLVVMVMVVVVMVVRVAHQQGGRGVGRRGRKVRWKHHTVRPPSCS